VRAARDVLAEYRAAKDRLRAKQDAIEGLICELTRTSARLGEVGLRQGAGRDRIGRIVADMEDAYAEVVGAGAAAAEGLECALRLIERAPTERQRLLLTLRYVKGLTWEGAAREAGVSRRHALRATDDALGVLDAHLAGLDGRYSAEP
jgi:DNA-directed RNA polymerase specialized sigma24 family protein